MRLPLIHQDFQYHLSTLTRDGVDAQRASDAKGSFSHTDEPKTGPGGRIHHLLDIESVTIIPDCEADSP
jgi:hypothetical protein